MAVSATDVQKAYLAYFGRPADPVGLAYWETQTAASMKAGFAASAEYAALYSGMTPAQMVAQVYLNVFGRTADFAGAVYWAGELTAGRQTVSTLVDSMEQNALGVDINTINNRVTYANAFTAAIDTTAELVGYSGTAAANAARAAVMPVLDTAASLTAAQTALTTSVATVVTAGTAAQATTFNLTTGIDHYTTTAANNTTINGVIGTASSNAGDTLNPLDSITATGTGNVLNISDQGVTGTAGTIPSITVSGVQTANIQSVVGETVDASGWTGLTSLNLSASAGTDTVTAAGTTAVVVTDTALTAAVGAATALSVDGGSTVAVTSTGASSGVKVTIGNISVGATTTPTGAVSVTSTETAGVTSTVMGNITAKGAAAVTVTSTQNAAFGQGGGGSSGAISATGTTNAGVVTVNSTTNVTETDNIASAITTATISATGGSSIVINDVVTASTAALAAALANAPVVTQGAITVQDGGTATSVTVNQTAKATSALATAAAVAGAPTAYVAGIGADVTLFVAGTAASALVPAVLGVAAGAVTVSGTTGTAAGNASNTITSVTLASYNGASYINSNALTSVTLSGAGVGGALTIYNQGGNHFTSLALNLNKFTDAANAMVISGNGVTTMTVTTGGSGSSELTGITDTSLTTLNVAGTQVFKLDTVNTALTTIAVTGAAGFNDNGSLASVTAHGSGLAFTTTSSGAITATLHAAGDDVFTGSTGQDVITITADQTGLVAAGSATNNELILKGAVATTFLGGATTTAAKVSGFTTLGINNAAANGTYNMALLTHDSINAIEVISGAGTTATFSNVAKNTSLTLDVASTTAAGFVYQSADAQSVTGNDSVTLTLGATTGGTFGSTADTGTTAALSSLVMEDTNSVGIATLNIVSAKAANTLVALCDSGLSNLNVSGSKALTIGVLNEGVTAGGSATAATSFTINNTDTATGTANVTLTTFTDSALGTLTFTGTGNSLISTLNVGASHILSVSNTGTGTATIGTMAADTSLTSLTLTGQVALGNDTNAGGIATAAETATGAATGVTVAAGTDNAHININLNAAGAGATNTITVGNGMDYITDATTAGAVNVTVGTGYNLIDVHTGANNATYSASITLGAHTNTATQFDKMVVSVTGSQAAGYSTTITGAAIGDQIVFADGNASALVTLTAAHQTAITAAADFTTALGLAFTDINVDTGHAAHAVMSFTYGGATYVIENVGADGTFTAGTDSVIKLVGTHTIAAVAGAVAIASIAS